MVFYLVIAIVVCLLFLVLYLLDWISKLKNKNISMNKKKTFYIYQGLQGSGKSTAARTFVLEDPDNRIRVNRDEIRLMMGKPFNPNLENIVTKIENAALTAAFKSGKDVVSDNMNLNSKIRKGLEKMARKYGYGVEYRFIYTPLEVCIERDSKREHPVGENVIKDTYKKYKSYIESHATESV